MPTICVDVMGSDQGPSVVLEGVERALAKDAELVVLLAGSDEEVTPFARIILRDIATLNAICREARSSSHGSEF